MKKLYDDSNPLSIYKYSRNLVGKTFKDIEEYYEEYKDNIVLKEDEAQYGNKKRKGGLGQLVEEKFFGYLINTDDGPDFKDANLELKVTPYKKNKNKTYSSKERLILTMINYFDIINEDFYDSRVWKKNELMLIIFYLWDKNIKNRLDYEITHTYLYTPPEDDLKIIIDDYNFIKKKVKEGKAHELSEGDTMYLGAATKAATSKDRREQPFSEHMAKPRAFSLKNSYMTYILRNYVLKGKDVYKPLEKYRSEKILKENIEEPFQEYILKTINKNIDKKYTELLDEYYDSHEIKNIKNSKSKYSELAFRMLGIKSNNSEEFEKANVVVKTIRLEKNNKIIESMSFPYFKIQNLVEKEWEDSELYNMFSETKFLFMIFQNNGEGEYIFKKGMFWNMPIDTIENELKNDWNKIRNTFIEGVKFNATFNKKGKLLMRNNLPKKKDLSILQIRPHSSKSYYIIDGIEYGNGKISDSDLLPNNDRMTKQCFWLQNTYIEKILFSTVF